MPDRAIVPIAACLIASMLFVAGCGHESDNTVKNGPSVREINLADTLRSLESQSLPFAEATTTLQREESVRQAASIAEQLFDNARASFGMPVRDVNVTAPDTVTLRFGQADSNAIPPKLQGILFLQPGQPIEVAVSMPREAALKIQAGSMATLSARLVFRPRQGGSMLVTVLTAATSKNLLFTVALHSRTAFIPMTVGDLYLDDIRVGF